ncbi:hypothetical protein SE19_06935 [Acidiplasma aeolicum]|jgi:hydroxyethylthiazole kinase-like uncharacterized protein yjeF|uniref:Bifunctional NAD(P)H-hydrate repair enzyme n=1 Tax=Acidiplasma aeolicum TaxID=507754 RepID=A0A0P9F3J4_9ARCH|nr:NAD(P)H-hydrate dehydratase [Acidiplasma aeolicum]KPV46124.1 hypothetical protein SE19_06935 [Acidiplasma aeolicum]KQB35929.1 hypothetical protein AOG54_02535 [Acidiplasma aeolicum]
MDYIEAKRDDLNYSKTYGDTYNLMINAGRAVAKFVSSKFKQHSKVLIVCGTGNNAGDGIMASSFLNCMDVKIQFIKEPFDLKTYEARRAFNENNQKYFTIEDLDKNIQESEIIIDAIFGIGINGSPREPYSSVISKINSSGKIIVSVDVPSGFPYPGSVKPDYTVTFTGIKDGMTSETCGEIIVSDIGIPENVIKYSGPGDLLYLPKPLPDSHKGMNGRIALISGFTYSGSAIIAARAAYNTGVDLVRVYTSQNNYNIISSYSAGLIVRTFNDLDNDDINQNDAILIGPGLGLSPGYRDILINIIKKYNGIIIADADALKLLSPGHLEGKKCAVTPHAGEFKMFYGVDATEENAVKMSKKYGIITVLKGKVDIITDGDNIFYTSGGNARMTMGGTGDMLAGLIAGMAAKHINLIRACMIGTYINKEAARICYDDLGYYYSIDDMINKIPYVINNKI